MFQSLYRKYRSQTFTELVGQEHVTLALRNAVREGRVGHAYLFTGPRGTGKTSTARILAKALNCEQLGADGEPCNTCASCTSITAGNSMDVMELDAASNNGVNEMRELLGRVAYRSAGGRWKVYIVDEVHMLSTAASNALLKTLEEPPEHVKFVLATTDPHKVLPTIRSRTQQFEFGLISTPDLAEHLARICLAEGVETDAEALLLVARRGAGSARDALSLLDQALAHGDGHLVTTEVRELFESTTFDRQASLLDAIGAEDAAGVIMSVEGILATGVDARALADDLLRYLRDMYVLAASRGAVTVDRVPEERDRLRAQGELLGASTVQRCIETLGVTVTDMVRAPDPRLVLEVALVRLSRRELGTQVEVLLERIERLERTVDELRRGRGRPAETEDAGASPSGASPAATSATSAAAAAAAAAAASSSSGAEAAPRATPSAAKAALGAFRTAREPRPAPAPAATPAATPAVGPAPTVGPAPAVGPATSTASTASTLSTLGTADTAGTAERRADIGPAATAVPDQDSTPALDPTPVAQVSTPTHGSPEPAPEPSSREPSPPASSPDPPVAAPQQVPAREQRESRGEQRRESQPRPRTQPRPQPERRAEPEHEAGLAATIAEHAAIDLDDLVDAPPTGGETQATDSVARMIQLFDATVVDEPS